MVITNGLVFGEDCVLVKADIACEGDRITHFAPAGSLPAGQAIDARGGFVLPGFVDIHTHGAVGADFQDADTQGLAALRTWYGSEGVTSVVATLAAGSPGVTEAAIGTLCTFATGKGKGARLRGIRLEGPFLNPAKAGALDPRHLLPPDAALLDEWLALAEGRISIVDIAPELPGALELIRAGGRRPVFSLGHTEATYEEAAAAFAAGAGHVTHLFNAMAPFHHRRPGLVGAAADHAGYAEVIADGVHLHPAAVRGAFSLLGPGRVCLVSDSMRAAGMDDGNYSLGGLPVRVRQGRATLEDGTLAGGTASLAECCRRAVGFGIPLEAAVRAATLNPAKAAGLEAEVGSLMPGKRADIVVWDRELATLCVIAGGQLIRDNRFRA